MNCKSTVKIAIAASVSTVISLIIFMAIIAYTLNAIRRRRTRKLEEATMVEAAAHNTQVVNPLNDEDALESVHPSEPPPSYVGPSRRYGPGAGTESIAVSTSEVTSALSDALATQAASPVEKAPYVCKTSLPGFMQ